MAFLKKTIWTVMGSKSGFCTSFAYFHILHSPFLFSPLVLNSGTKDQRFWNCTKIFLKQIAPWYIFSCWQSPQGLRKG